MTSYQKVRTTQPSSVKHANESYSRGEPNFSKASIEAGGLRAADQEDHAKNYSQFQQRMKEMKLRAQHLQDLQTMKAMGIGIAGTSSSQNSGRQGGPE